MGRTGGAVHVVIDAEAVETVRVALAAAVPTGAGVVLAVSGGSDSVGMTHLVTTARPDLDVCVVHVRHGLRDDAADAAAAAQCAAALALPLTVVAVSVPRDGTGPEGAARSARMAALGDAAHASGAAFVFTGHTADDNAETTLLNLARGTGLAGLAGIPELRRLTPAVLLVRPVLRLRRSAVRRAAADAGATVVQDPTNDDPRQRRARARSQLLPLLQSLTGADTDAVEALARLARHARADAAALDTIAAAETQRLVRSWGPVVAAPCSALSALPRAVASRVVREMVAAAGGLPGEAEITAVLDLREGQAATLSRDVVASVGGGRLAVAATGRPLPLRHLNGERLALPEVGLELRCSAGSSAGAVLPPWAPLAATAVVPVADPAGVVVRSRRAGDRIVTAAGTQTVADAMINAGVPRVARDFVPVVADAHGPLWVPGVAVRADVAGHLRLRLVAAQGQ